MPATERVQCLQYASLIELFVRPVCSCGVIPSVTQFFLKVSVCKYVVIYLLRCFIVSIVFSDDYDFSPHRMCGCNALTFKCKVQINNRNNENRR